MEKALAIGQLKESFHLSVRDIAKKLGMSKSAVQRSLDVLELPEDLQEALIAGKPESKILILKDISNFSERKKLLLRIDDLTRNALRELVEELSHGGTKGASKKPVRKNKKELSTADKRIVENIQRSLGSKVKFSRKPGSSKGGSLTIDFYTNSDLEELYKRLT